jgi:nicotinate phosphoribosyltransferase
MLVTDMVRGFLEEGHPLYCSTDSLHVHPTVTWARLDLKGFWDVKIFVRGELDPDCTQYFLDNGTPVDYFGVGNYISSARPIDFTADLHALAGKPTAEEAGTLGTTPNFRLRRVL